MPHILMFIYIYIRKCVMVFQIVCSGLLSQQPVVLSAEQGNFRDFSTFKNCIEAALHVPGCVYID